MGLHTIVGSIHRSAQLRSTFGEDGRVYVLGNLLRDIVTGDVILLEYFGVEDTAVQYLDIRRWLMRPRFLLSPTLSSTAEEIGNIVGHRL